MSPYMQIISDVLRRESTHTMKYPMWYSKKVSDEVFHRDMCNRKNSFDLLRVFPIPKYRIKTSLKAKKKRERKNMEQQWCPLLSTTNVRRRRVAAAPNNLSLLLLFIYKTCRVALLCLSLSIGGVGVHTSLQTLGDEKAQRAFLCGEQEIIIRRRYLYKEKRKEIVGTRQILWNFQTGLVLEYCYRAHAACGLWQYQTGCVQDQLGREKRKKRRNKRY